MIPIGQGTELFDLEKGPGLLRGFFWVLKGKCTADQRKEALFCGTDGTEYYLSAETKEEKLAWMNAIGLVAVGKIEAAMAYGSKKKSQPSVVVKAKPQPPPSQPPPPTTTTHVLPTAVPPIPHTRPRRSMSAVGFGEVCLGDDATKRVLLTASSATTTTTTTKKKVGKVAVKKRPEVNI